MGDPCRVWLGGWVCGEGDDPQAAADDLVDRLTGLAREMPAGEITRTVDKNAPSALRLLAVLGRRVTSLEDRRIVVLGRGR